MDFVTILPTHFVPFIYSKSVPKYLYYLSTLTLKFKKIQKLLSSQTIFGAQCYRCLKVKKS